MTKNITNNSNLTSPPSRLGRTSRKGFAKVRRFVCFFLFCFFSVSVFSQTETTVVGQIFDKYYKTPLSSVNIYFKNTGIGTTSNEEGYFLIRSWEQEHILVFSSIGYKTKEIKVRIGQPAYLNVELEEQNTWLKDVLILPGVNPALEWMKKIRMVRKENDVTNSPAYKAESTEQELILLSKVSQHNLNHRLYEQLQKGNLTASDSSLLIPLYMAESTYEITNKGQKEISKNLFSTPEVTDNLVVRISGGINPELNFYNNSVAIFGKSIISPLANISNSYYNYYLADSISTDNGKQYEIHFRSKNQKNLAFNGRFRFDSLSLSLTYIEARLPARANMNFINNLYIQQVFEPFVDNVWVLNSNDLTLSMTYDIVPDTLNTKPELLIKQSSTINVSDSMLIHSADFARSDYSLEMLESKLQEFDNTPLMRTAKWIADAVMTSYAQVGVIDIGRLQQVIRLTDIEGVRLALPLRTNERLWKNISLGGYIGYGFRNNEIKYSAFGQFRLLSEKRHVFEIRYTDDYRRVDYNYNNYLIRESPWNIGDDDIVTTLFSFNSGNKISPRKEFSFSYSNDWNKNVESMTSLRLNRLYGNQNLPLEVQGVSVPYFTQQSFTSVTRFSFNEKKYEDHLQRIYIEGRKPVVYATFEGGRYQINSTSAYYGKVIGSIKQNVRLDIGQWNYMAEAGCVLGRVPYPLLAVPPGNEPSGVSFYQYNRMKYMEFAYDKYIFLNNEFIFNGLLFNHIPLIKYLNLRELVSLKAVFGSRSDKHADVLDFPNPELYPDYLRKMKNPYIECGFGVTNLLRIFTIQMNWRITNNYDGISPWRIAAGLRLGF